MNFHSGMAQFCLWWWFLGAVPPLWAAPPSSGTQKSAEKPQETGIDSPPAKVEGDQQSEVKEDPSGKNEPGATIRVRARSQGEKLRRSSMPLTVIDTNQVQHESIGASGLLDRAPGVTIRSSGALGSRTNVHLNGLGGRSVRIFRDQIPINYLGMGFHPGMIPVNSLERVEIYKGVLPVALGADALGGGINFVSKQQGQDYADFSYSFGSFNTHVATVNARKQSDSGFFAETNTFYNYSDNDYRVKVERLEFDDYSVRPYSARLFHNAYYSLFSEVQTGVMNQPWADLLTLGVAFSTVQKEIQHGLILGKVPYGEVSEGQDAVTPSIRYRKYDFLEVMAVDFFSAVSFQNEYFTDRSSKIYEWDGSIGRIKTASDSGEMAEIKSDRTFKTIHNVNRLNLNLPIGRYHALVANSVYSHNRRRGDDPLYKKLAGYDPAADERHLIKSISGAGYRYDKADVFAFEGVYKQYYYQVEQRAVARRIEYTDVGRSLNRDGAESGVAVSAKYHVLASWWWKSSYEYALRIPEPEEFLGENSLILANIDLKPERSHNVNLGTRWEGRFRANHKLNIEAGVFYRDTEDYIYLNYDFVNGYYDNDTTVETKGVEFAFDYQPWSFLVLGTNLTYQDVRKTSYAVSAEKPLLDLRFPNTPWLFGNSFIRLPFKDVLLPKDFIQIYSYFRYVHGFDRFYALGAAPSRDRIPSQFSVDVGCAYGVDDGGLTFSFEAHNISDAELFDEYLLQKPGRSFYVKARYLIAASG